MEKKELLESIQKCGHFLHRRKGKKLGQYRILLILKKEGALLQKDLQDKLCIKSGSISEIVLKMETNGLIERHKDISDKRKIIVSLTDKGFMYVDELIHEYEKENECLLDSLSESECLELNNLLNKLYTSWNGGNNNA